MLHVGWYLTFRKKTLKILLHDRKLELVTRGRLIPKNKQHTHYNYIRKKILQG